MISKQKPRLKFFGKYIRAEEFDQLKLKM